MPSLQRPLALSCFVVLLGACASNPGEDACEAFVDAYTTRASDECALGTREEIRAAIFVGFSPLGVDECSDFTKVRDEDSFYAECIPAIQVLECSAFSSSSSLPTSCSTQLQVVR